MNLDSVVNNIYIYIYIYCISALGIMLEILHHFHFLSSQIVTYIEVQINISCPFIYLVGKLLWKWNNVSPACL